MKYYLLCDPEIQAEDLQKALNGDEAIRESLIDFCAHLGEGEEGKADCEMMLADPASYGSEGQHVIEFDSEMDHESLSIMIFE